MPKGIFTKENRTLFMVYYNGVFDMIRHTETQVEIAMDEFLKTGKESFKINGKNLSTQEMLALVWLFRDKPAHKIHIIGMWGEEKRTYIKNALVKAEEFIEKVPGAKISKRPEFIERLMEQGKSAAKISKAREG